MRKTGNAKEGISNARGIKTFISCAGRRVG